MSRRTKIDHHPQTFLRIAGIPQKSFASKPVMHQTTDEPMLATAAAIKRVPAPLLWVTGAVVVAALFFWLGRSSAPARTTTEVLNTPAGTIAASDSGQNATQLYAHNLLLRKGPHFRVYVRWIRGLMLSTRTDRNPSFDVPESFVLEIQKGVINAKFADIADYLNSGQPGGKPPLKDIKIENHDGLIQIKGTAHKGISVPVRLDGTLTPLPDGRIKFHLVKLNVLKVPMKGLFGLFHIDLSDLAPKTSMPGMEVAGNDVYLDTQRLLPPPHIHGHISSVTASDTELTLIYGGAKNDEGKLVQWHNFLRLTGGNLDFGKLSMRQVDLTMIDATDDPWFDLDLVNYQAQLVYGTTRMTEKAGLEIYMPDLGNITTSQKKASHGVTLEWLKNRGTSPALEVPTK
jgi:hypothetical protein